MTSGKTAVLATALFAAAGLGAALTPAAQAQGSARALPRALELLGGGSQIGISIRDVTDEDVKSAKLTSASGVIVDTVSEDSPAEKAGVKRGDVIVEYDGEKIRSARQLTRLVQETVAGRSVPAAIMRDGQRTPVTLTPRQSGGASVWRNGSDAFALAMPPTPPAPPSAPGAPTPPVPPASRFFMPDLETFVWRTGGLGITVADMSSQLADYFGTKDGVLVTAVRDDSPAAKAGVKAGDVITSFNGASVDTPAMLQRRIQRLESGEEFTIGAVRDKKPVTLKGKVEAERQSRSTYRSVL